MSFIGRITSVALMCLFLLPVTSPSHAASCRQVSTSIENWNRSKLINGAGWETSKAGIDANIKNYQVVTSNLACLSKIQAEGYKSVIPYAIDACTLRAKTDAEYDSWYSKYFLMKDTYKSNFKYFCSKWKNAFQ